MSSHHATTVAGHPGASTRSPTWSSLALKGILGIALFAIANLATYYTSGYYEREREYDEGVQDYFTRPHATALFAGDSHVAQLDNELLADDVYNVAFGGDSLREVYAKLRYLLWRGARIQTLYLTADAHMFGDGRMESSNRAFVDPYLLETLSSYGMQSGWPSTALGSVPLFNDDFVQYLKKRITMSLKGETPALVRGEEAVPWETLTDAEREAQAVSTGKMDHAGIGAHPEPFLWYERIAALAVAHHVHIVAVLYPAHPGYINSVPSGADARVAAELAALHITDVLDFRHAFSQPSYFSDPDHVSRKGAIALLELISTRTGHNILAATIVPDAARKTEMTRVE
ncbi:MAG TPA: hypothetical protein VJQ47_09555 [Steroidobacteraceae bacterium]|nr:hypothetical protein [Steroidobacteraceae bacterium]